VRERAADYGLEILNSDWKQYDANHVVTRTTGADVGVLKAVSDAYEDTIHGYQQYQDTLYAQGKLAGYELQTYVRRKRQSLLWKLLLDDAVDGFAPFRSPDPVAELEAAVVEHTREDAGLVHREMGRVLELGALRAEPARDGVRFAWTE
jgi:hypothetical protein